MLLILKDYKKKLDEKQWETIEVKDTTKGKLKLTVHVMQVWVWDNKEEQARKPVLLINWNNQSNEIKCRDIRILIIALLAGDEELNQKRTKQMEFRHRQRDKDIKRHFKT